MGLNAGHQKTRIGRPERPWPVGRNALFITAVYAASGIAWILFSDSLAGRLFPNLDAWKAASMVKGVFYVLATATLLYALVSRALRAESNYSAELDESYSKLQGNYDALEESRRIIAESEEQYRNLFNEMLYGWCVHELVPGEGGEAPAVRTLSRNPACERIAGWESSQQDFELTKLLPGDRRFWLDGFRNVVETGSTMRFQVFSDSAGKHLEFTVFRPSPGRFATVFNDVTERVQMEKALAEETERLSVTLDSIGDGVIASDTRGTVTMANGVAEQLTGWHNGSSIGVPLGDVLEIYGEQSDAAFASSISAAFGRGEETRFAGSMKIRSRDGIERIISGRAAPLKDSSGERLGLVFVFRDVTEQHNREAEILYLSYHDTLTGLYNRAFFEEELKRLDTERQLPLSVILCDANNLKLVNDVFGHSEGDELIRVMARVLKESCRAEDIISRWGGDEFTILLPRTGAEGADAICRRIAERCVRFRTDGRSLSPSMSIGHDTKTSMDTDIAHVIKAAEDMMYQNKLLGSRAANNEFLSSMLARMGDGGQEDGFHTARMSELCDRIAREMNLTNAERADLRTLSLLHDIGKAAVDPRILYKPGGLTDAEWEEIKRHPGIGYRIVRSAPELVLVAEYILGHHERWDGNGYPQGLKGEAIPLPSRIIAVVDAFSVMTRGRPYKGAVSQEEALKEICRNSGTQFDPAVVDAFASVLDNLADMLGADGEPQPAARSGFPADPSSTTLPPA